MITLAARVDQYLRAQGLAIIGVSIADDANRATWKVHPSDLQAAAQPHIDAFVLPTAQQILDEEASREADLRILRAIVMEIFAIIPAHAGKGTLIQLRNNIIARYKALA